MNFQSFFKEGRLKLEQVGRRLTRLKALHHLRTSAILDCVHGRLQHQCRPTRICKQIETIHGQTFHNGKERKNIFQQSSASVDVTVLLQAWLDTVGILQQRFQENYAEIQKMRLLRIIYHGWKSQPGEIDQFPQAEDEDDSSEDLWERCIQSNHIIDQYDSDENFDFEATFDLAQKYCLTEHSELTQDTCMSHIRVPVFGILKPIQVSRQRHGYVWPLAAWKYRNGLDKVGSNRQRN